MSKKERKYYVVWEGKNPGVYGDWPTAQTQVVGFAGARFKSFVSLEEAKLAFQRPWQDFVSARPEGEFGAKQAKGEPKILTDEMLKVIVPDSISVDAACAGNPGKMEYRGVYTLAPEIEIFRSQVFALGTNNIGEFLALVHALAMFHESKPELTIYSDSKLAQGWIKKKACRTTLPINKKTEYLHSLIARAENWLKTHKFKNKILKWETKKWGEIPADFGRK
jgi:ribonuclease HI